MECWRRKKKNKEKQKEKAKARKWFLKNGSMFLQQLIADCNGISNPIRMFSSHQIKEATNNFDRKASLSHNKIPLLTWYKGSLPGNTIPSLTWYKGIIEGRSYAIKKSRQSFGTEPYNDIVLSARVSNYKGFVKLVGCCLEFPDPVVVFEDLDYRFLNDRGSVGQKEAPLLPWNVRLKIAKDVASAITYLHTAFPRIIVHRDIKSDNVLLDKNGTAKLTDLSEAVTLPEGKSWIEEPRLFGTMGYIDPVYRSTGIVTEYSDVYSFGILMLVLLMGKPAYLAGVNAMRSPKMFLVDYVKYVQERGEPVQFGGDSNDMKPGQMKMFLEVALRCCEKKNEDRPKMISVANEIKLIEKNIT